MENDDDDDDSYNSRKIDRFFVWSKSNNAVVPLSKKNCLTVYLPSSKD